MEGLAAPEGPARAGPTAHAAAVLVAVAGGMLAAPAAVIEEVRAGAGLLLPFIAAPVVEETLKPAGLYLLLIRWPGLVRGRLHAALLAAVAGLTFGLIESAAFVTIAADEPTRTFVIYRFSLPLVLHATASFIAGTGIGPGLIAWARTGAHLPRAAVRGFGAAIALHALYNTVVVALERSGVTGFR